MVVIENDLLDLIKSYLKTKVQMTQYYIKNLSGNPA
jgi:hypothetical protein